MTIKVKFFAIAREKAGTGEAILHLPDDATVAGAAVQIARQFPGLAATAAKCAIAVNQEYAASDRRLRDGDELALIPAVSGG